MMLEKGIVGEYEETVINMLGKGDQKSWSQCDFQSYILQYVLMFLAV